MNYNVLLEMSQKINIDREDIKNYHCIFEDLDIVPGSFSIVVEPKTISEKVGHLGHREKQEIFQDGYATAKQKKGDNIIITLRYDKYVGKSKVLYTFFLLEDGLYFVHDYAKSYLGDTVEFSYYDKEACDTVIKPNEKLSIKTLSEFDKMGIRSDYSEKVHIFDIIQAGGFAHYVDKIDKVSKKKGYIRGTSL